MAAPSPLNIRLERLTKTYPGSASSAVEELTLTVPAGEIVALIGPSGCGKTTILKMINRLVEPSSGRIVIGGRDATDLPAHELRRGIGYVIQHVGLFPHRTVAANIGTVPRLLGWDRGRIAERSTELAELVGLDRELLARYPAELSGGQQQRVGVARALAADPPILLMDEPYSAVDPLVRSRLQDELLALQRRLGRTIVLVTHDLDEAVKLGDRIALLNVGGVLEQYDRPEQVLRAPASPFVERFVGAERTLRRLGLLTVADIELVPVPPVEPATGAAEARRRLAAERADWLAVVTGERLVGWVRAEDLADGGTVGDAELRPWPTELRPATPLREAVDAILTSPNGAAAVIGSDGRFLGTLGVADVSDRVR